MAPRFLTVGGWPVIAARRRLTAFWWRLAPFADVVLLALVLGAGRVLR
jgi:hypothetical protein